MGSQNPHGESLRKLFNIQKSVKKNVFKGNRGKSQLTIVLACLKPWVQSLPALWLFKKQNKEKTNQAEW